MEPEATEAVFDTLRKGWWLKIGDVWQFEPPHYLVSVRTSVWIASRPLPPLKPPHG